MRAEHQPAHLLGRDACLELIDRLIGEIEDAGAALLLSGEPGIGKSALLNVARHRAEARGISVVTMTGILAEVHLPFAALELALRPLMKRVKLLPPRQQSALLAAFGIRDAAAPPDIFLVGLATLSLLTESAARKPILLIADDIQWLDQATYDVLAFVVRRLRSDPIVLMAAIRDGFDRTFGGTDIERLRLARLDNTDAEHLLTDHAPGLSPVLKARFLEQAAGNPLALVELPRSAPGADAGDMPWLPLTERLERAFSGRVSGLPAATRTLLLVLAENDGGSLREVLDAGEVLLGESAGLDALAPAISALLVEVEKGEVRFLHPLVRSALHQAASPVMRYNVHAALARVIKDQPDRRIWHRMASTVAPDEALAQELDAAAARSQRRGALATAVIALESAARLSGDAGAKSERLLRAATLAVHLGQPDTMERLLRDADLEQPRPHMRARLEWIREISRPLGTNDLARVSALVRFAADARAHRDDDLALGFLWRAAQRCWWGVADDAVRSDIVAAANETAMPREDARRIAIAGYVGPLENGSELYRQLAAHATAAVEDPAAASILGFVANTIGAFEFSIGWMTTACAAFREQGRLGDLARGLFARGCAEAETGDWMGALENCAEAARLAEETRQMVWAAAATIVLALLQARRGDFDAAESHAAQAEQLLLSPGTGFWRALLHDARGIAALSAGQPQRAHEHLLHIWTPGDPAFNTSLQFYCLANYVEASVACGREAADAAAAAVEEVQRRSGPAPVPWVRMILAYSKALLATPDRAETFFQDALGTDVQTWPFRRGRCLLAYGEWLRRQRRVMDARGPLRTARDVFDALGAAPWGERARRELRAAGETSRPRAGRAFDALTPQELQIAELAAGGFSNKEIGARMYLSHRTVGYHLHRIFSKTGITSRSGLHPLLAEGARPAG